MRDITEELGFCKIGEVLARCGLRIEVAIVQMDNIYVKCPMLPVVSSFESTMPVTETIRKAVLVLLERGDENVLCAGYTKVKGNACPMANLQCVSPNTTTNFFKYRYWTQLLKSAGDELSLFLLTECLIIEKVDTKNVLLAGSIKRMMYVSSTNKPQTLDRQAIFCRRISPPRTEYGDVIPAFRHACAFESTYDSEAGCVRTDKIHIVVDRYRKLKIGCMFRSTFEHELDVRDDTTLADYVVDARKLVDFLFCISRRIMSGCITFYNFRILKSKLTLFVMRNKFESLTLAEIRKHFRLNDTMLFRGTRCTRTEFCERARMFSDFVFLLFERIYIPVVSKYFYTTETSFSKLQTCYFTRRVWSFFSSVSVKSFLENYSAVDAQKSFNRIRAIPKKDGFRVVVNMQEKYSLKSAHAVLLGVLESRSESSVLRYEDANDRIQEYRKGHANLFLLKFDLKRCFDNIPHAELRSVLADAFENESYCIKKFHVLEKVAGQFRLKVVRRHVKKRMSLAEIVAGESIRRNQIVCESVFDDHRSRHQMIADIEGSLLNNVVKHGNMFYKQAKGIPQGSVLSPIVCSLYLSHIDRMFLRGIVQAGIVMRYIDDFIIITPDVNEIRAYMQKVRCLGHQGLSVNTDKVESNFALDASFGIDGCRHGVKDHVVWCGLKVFSRHVGIKCAFDVNSLQHSFALSGAFNGASVFSKLQRQFQRHMSVILVNRDNPYKFQNLYDTFLVLGKRLAMLLRRIDFVNARFVARMCADFVAYAQRCLRRRGIAMPLAKVTDIAHSALDNAGLGCFLVQGPL